MSDLFAPAVEKIVWRTAGMAAKLAKIYDNPADVVTWFVSPQDCLSGEKPVNLMMTETGWIEVHDEVQRLVDSVHV